MGELILAYLQYESKTRVCRLPEEKFDFLGYTFGRCYSPKTGRTYWGTTPSKKRVQRLCKSITASTQCGDWEGTVAADGQPHSLHEYLREKGLMAEHEFLLAATIYFGEHDFDSPFIRAFVFEKGRDFKSVKQEIDTIKGPILVREVKLEMTAKEFLDLFKRFDVVLTWHGLDLKGREYSTTNK